MRPISSSKPSTKRTLKLAASLSLVALIFGSAYGLLGPAGAADLPAAANGANPNGALSLLMHVLGPIAAIPALIGIWSQRFPLVGGLVLACPAIAVLLLHRFVIG
ncbi:hypothetical protein ACKI2N_011335 [Cupriavidus sp. 30B13]|uniref:hypothetical protein n=1 Tax=Cupriavidus sp. 30B13 TaxID=3384241 RepID=UPI003B8F7524